MDKLEGIWGYTCSVLRRACWYNSAHLLASSAGNLGRQPNPHKSTSPPPPKKAQKCTRMCNFAKYQNGHRSREGVNQRNRCLKWCSWSKLWKVHLVISPLLLNSGNPVRRLKIGRELLPSTFTCLHDRFSK